MSIGDWIYWLWVAHICAGYLIAAFSGRSRLLGMLAGGLGWTVGLFVLLVTIGQKLEEDEDEAEALS